MGRGGEGAQILGLREGRKVLPIRRLSARGCDRHGRPHEGGDEDPFPAQAQPLWGGGTFQASVVSHFFFYDLLNGVDTLLSIIYSLSFNIQGNKKVMKTCYETHFSQRHTFVILPFSWSLLLTGCLA